MIQGQFPGAAGTPNSTAIHKDSNLFIAWANHCSIERGWLNISNQGMGKASLGEGMSATGEPGQKGILSLGDGGVAVVQFEQPIKNGPGPDFAIFENSFSDFFLELAFVEVSSDNQTWVRFPAACNLSQDTQIGPFDEKSDPTKLNNLAGKYRAQYGTPFDLEELKDSVGIKLDSIVYIRIIDCVGSINASFASFDSKGNKVNDPYPTPFASCGFDLDAVGVIHQNVVSLKAVHEQSILVYPNPLHQGEKLKIVGIDPIHSVLLYNLTGDILFQGTVQNINKINLKQGVYQLIVHNQNAIRLQVY